MPLKGLKGGSGVKPLGYGLGAAAEESDPNFNQTTLLLHGDGSEGAGDTAALGDPNFKAFKDNSTSAHALTVQGNAYGNDFSPYYYADGYWSNSFDGTGYISFPNNSDFAFGTGAFTIEFWFNGPLNNDKFILSGRASVGTLHITFGGYGGSTAGALRYVGSSTITTGTDLISDGTWHHVAIERSESNNIVLYIDGVSKATGTDTTNYSTTTGTWYFGANDIGQGNNPTGNFSNFRIVKGSNVYGSAFTPPTAPFTDPSVAGEMSVEFDGTDDVLSIPDDTSLDFGTGDWTIECWFYQTKALSNYQTLWSKYASNAGYYVHTTSTGAILLGVSNVTSTTSTATFSLNSWHHLAVTRNGNTLYVWLDGTQIDTLSFSGNNDNSTPFLVGNLNGFSRFFGGSISNFRVVKGTALYTSGFTPSTSPFTTTSQGATASEVELLTCQSKSFVDESSNTHPISLVSAPRVTEFSPFNHGYWSTYFSGSEDFEFSSNTGFNITDYVTLECWVSFASLGSGVLITGRESNYWLGYNHTGIGGASNKFVFAIYNGSSWSAVSSSTTPVVGGYYHIMGVKDGTTLRFYFNGAQENTGTMSGSPNNSANNFFVGANNGAESMTGYVSNVRLVTGGSNTIFPYSGLTSGSSFTVPTTPLTSVSGTQILTSLGNRFVDFNTDTTAKTFSNFNGSPSIDEYIPFELLSRQTKLITCQGNRFKDIIPNRHTLTVSGNPKVSAYIPFTVTKTANVGSGFFNGDTTSTSSRSTTGDKIFTTSTSADWAFGTGDFTVECWVYPNGSVTDARGILSNREGGGNTYWALHYFGTTANQLHWHTGGTAVANSSPYIVTPNAWNHLAVTRESGTARMYINGVQVTTWSDSYNYSTVFHLDIAEEIYTNSFFGYIADVHIIKGTAKYTSNFTPSTSTISADSNTKILTCQYSGAVRNVGFVDDSKYNHRVTRIGDSNVGTFSPFSLEEGYWSNLFTVNDTTMSLTSTAALQLSGVFTVECWVYLNSLTTDGGPHPSILTFPSNGSYVTQLYLQSSNNYVGWYYNGNIVNTTNNSISKNKWHHIAVARDASNQVALWLDGTRISALATGQSTSYGNSSGTFYIGSYNSTTGEVDGYISNIRIVKGYDVYGTTNTSISVPTTPLTAVTGTSLLTCQSNRFIDNSSSPYTLTIGSGQSVQPFSPFAPSRSYSKDVVGGSAYFDGSTDGLVLTDAKQPLGTNNFEVEFWYYPIGSSNNGYVFNTSHNNSSFGPILIYIVSLDVRLYSSSTGGGWNVFNNHNLGTVKANSWNHIYLSRVSNAVYAFVNGVASAGNGTTWNTDFTIATAPLHISTYDSSGSGSAYGYVANVQYNIGSGSTTKSVPTALTTLDSDTYVQLNFDNAGIIDHTMRSNLETEGGVRISTIQKKFGTGSIFFPSSPSAGDQIEIAYHKYHQLGTGEFTVEFFVYLTSTNGTQGFLGNDSPGWYFQIYAGELELAQGSGAVIERAWSHNINQWYHLAVTRDSSNDIRIFVDGTQQGAVVNSTTDFHHASNGLQIGGIGPSFNRFFQGGYMDEIRIIKGAAKYTSNFTVPTKAFANR